jgi:hypothetical protein
MAFYAKIDPAASQPSRVLGYYDTGFVTYDGLDFNQPEFVELSPAQWAARKGDSHHLHGQLIPKPTPTAAQVAGIAKVVAQRAAQKALVASSEAVVMRCFEIGKGVPADWKAYRETLRKIIAGSDTPLPTAPPIPAFD